MPLWRDIAPAAGFAPRLGQCAVQCASRLHTFSPTASNVTLWAVRCYAISQAVPPIVSDRLPPLSSNTECRRGRPRAPGDEYKCRDRELRNAWRSGSDIALA